MSETTSPSERTPFRVRLAFRLDGTIHDPGERLDLTAEQAARLVRGGIIERADPTYQTPDPPVIVDLTPDEVARDERQRRRRALSYETRSTDAESQIDELFGRVARLEAALGKLGAR